MKVNDSGMPEESYWNSLFDIPQIVNWLELESINGPIVEIGCGYGTFSIPIAKKCKNEFITFDIDSSMIEITRNNALKNNLSNIQVHLIDILDNGTGIQDNTVGMVLLFNILHFVERKQLIEEATRILKPNGTLAVIHWRKDIETPRGPNPILRPDKETILNAIQGTNLLFNGNNKVLEPYHWGIQLIKKENK